MPFIDRILSCKSLSIAGMAKNTGKTECLNYIINRLSRYNCNVAVTSIGIDGETVDQVTQSSKPEIKLNENTVIITSEQHYRSKHITAEILDVSNQTTPLGRLVTARTQSKGRIIFSGPSTTKWLKEIIDKQPLYNVNITLVDGALSRLSPASPSITDGMILTTGAALSTSIPNIVKQTKHVCSLINLSQYNTPILSQLLDIEHGVWAISPDNCLHNLHISSTLFIEKNKDKLFSHGNTLFISGIVTEQLLNTLRIQKTISETEIIIKDFTKIFVSPSAIQTYIAKGGKIKTLLKTKLIAICINPTSPQGYTIPSDKLIDALSETLQMPVYNIKQPQNENI